MDLARYDPAELARRAQATANAALSPATRKAYGADWRDFRAWCEAHSFRAGPPCPGELVALYLNDLFERGPFLAGKGREPCALSTITRKLAAIAQAHAAIGADTPRASPALRQVLKGIRRKLAEQGRRSKGKAALELGALREVAIAAGSYLIGRRDRAILVFGWAGAFRRSELCALELGDLEERAEGYVVTLRRSKTDQAGQGQKKAMPFGSNPTTCPVRTVKAWIDAADLKEGRLFRSVDRHGNVGASLDPQTIAAIIKRHCKAAGLDPREFSGHSLRAGFCTTAARAGKSPRSIMSQTGHRTIEMVFRYVREAKLFEENAAMGIGL